VNQFLFLQRIQGPALLLTFGVAALLDQWHILSFGRSWPLYLIVLGVLKLAQRAALANAEPPPYPAAGYPGYQPSPGAPVAPAHGSSALVPTDPSQIHDSGDRR
jgi:hypothetical protein